MYPLSTYLNDAICSAPGYFFDKDGEFDIEEIIADAKKRALRDGEEINPTETDVMEWCQTSWYFKDAQRRYGNPGFYFGTASNHPA